jgi:hypothetical protein
LDELNVLNNEFTNYVTTASAQKAGTLDVKSANQVFRKITDLTTVHSQEAKKE